MAKFQVAAVFSNHMVLQRNKNINVFGKGENQTEVTVTLGQHTVTTTVSGETWRAVLPPLAADNGLEMNVTSGDNQVVFKNIAIGEVWLAGGQSNMELELQNSKDGEQILETDKNTNVRFYYTPKNSYMDDKFFQDEEASSWHEFSQDKARNWSAVGYHFGKRLAAELGVTVGIIGCNWGGTSAAAWMDKERLAVDLELKTYLDEYEKAIAGISEEQQIKEYDEYVIYHEEWDKKCTAIYKEEPDIEWDVIQDRLGVCKWPGPMNCKNPYRPAGLYECMVKRIMPYTLNGFIYYQGESDDHKPQMYYKLLTNLIQQWRGDWEDDSLPFLLVQLPMHRYKQDEDFKNWCLIREAQMKTFHTIKNTGIAVILDKGEFNEIHPKDKFPVGERLALQALFHVYKKIEEKDAFGPIYSGSRYYQDKIELVFEYAEDGFELKGNHLGFEIAGEDKVYTPAEVEFCENTITVFSRTITNPKYVRYLWTNHGEVSIFGKNGIPLAPFRNVDKA